MCRNLVALAALLLVASPALTADPPGFRGTVLHAADAGTLLVRRDGDRKPITVRLIGLTPPVKATRDKDGQEPWATRGQQALAVLAARKEVRVEFDVLRAEPGQASVWAYVWVPGKDGDVLLNEAVLKGGHAVLDTRPPNVKYAERLRDAQKDAREAGRNIWDMKEPLAESPGEYTKKVAAGEDKPAVVMLEKWEVGCVVGNKKTKKYHLPGGRYYESGKDSANAVFFKTEEDAKKAGYERSAR